MSKREPPRCDIIILETRGVNYGIIRAWSLGVIVDLPLAETD